MWQVYRSTFRIVQSEGTWYKIGSASHQNYASLWNIIVNIFVQLNFTNSMYISIEVFWRVGLLPVFYLASVTLDTKRLKFKRKTVGLFSIITIKLTKKDYKKNVYIHLTVYVSFGVVRNFKTFKIVFDLEGTIEICVINTKITLFSWQSGRQTNQQRRKYPSGVCKKVEDPSGQYRRTRFAHWSRSVKSVWTNCLRYNVNDKWPSLVASISDLRFCLFVLFPLTPRAFRKRRPRSI